MKKLNEEIKTGQLKQVYLLCGEEAYLRTQYRDRLKTALLDGGDPMNLHYFEGKGIQQGEVIDLAETMPFLASRRVLVLENSEFFKHGGEALAEYLAAPAQTAFLCLWNLRRINAANFTKQSRRAAAWSSAIRRTRRS